MPDPLPPPSDTTTTRQPRLQVHPVVFWVSAGLILFFVLLTAVLAAFKVTVDVDGSAIPILEHFFSRAQEAFASKVGWFFVLAVNVYLIFTIYLAFSRFGEIKLGSPESKPEFSLVSWFCMLFSAGMGIGLLFYSVAEPIYHYASPPFAQSTPAGAARQAMTLTFFHWGLHAWGIYALVALALGYFSFRHKLPLTIRSAFYPLLGNRIHGPIGNIIDILAVVATLFGVATSLGLGVQQVNAGLGYLFNLAQNAVVQVLLIAIITAMATTSVVLGLDRGIRRLSEFTMILGLALLIFVFLVGPTSFLLDSSVQNVGRYLQDLPELSLWTEAYRQMEWKNDANWQHSWTIFYWAWWIAWSPFVGMFIARISRGRTIREFVLGVLLVPTLLTFVWLSVFGGTALYEELAGRTAISEAVNANIATSLFVMLEQFPLARIASFLAVIVVVVFFVTSSDSGSLVIDIITAGGMEDPPVAQRIFWAVLEGVVAAILLLVGGLKALQTAAITTGLPFAVVLLVMCYSLYKGIKQDQQLFLEETEPKPGARLYPQDQPQQGPSVEAPRAR